VYDARGRIIGAQAIFWDVTERKLAEEEIRLKNRDLETLLYVVSHDLREPLRAIESFSKLVVDRYAANLDDTGQDFLGRVIGGAARMNRLLDDVLMLSRAQRMERPSETVPAREIVDDVLKQLRLKIEETAARVTVAGSLPSLRVDRRWATQAVLNLVANALKFTRLGEPPKIEILSYRRHKGEPPGVGLVVRDHGPGVEANHAERIFNLFQRAVGREIAGTGAGLAIVRQIAERHQGRAWVRTGLKHAGAEFVVTFGGTPK
jgi:signal transduction histidine kinase